MSTQTGNQAGEDRHVLRAGGISAAVLAQGAELCSLRDMEGHERLWQAGPLWPRHAPVLFPIIGRLPGDTLHHDGQDYHLGQHGLARDCRFTWLDRSDTVCRLVLEDSTQTRALYPFAFRLELTFSLTDDSLEVHHRVSNPGDVVLPASLGGHPAFMWPTVPDAPRDAHRLLFAEPEPAPIRRISQGLLLPDTLPTPINGRELLLRDSLFDADAVILDHPASRSVRFGAPGHPGLEVSWDGFHELGIWSKPGGAPFLCIEPWYGFTSPQDFKDDFVRKPGLMLIPPGENRELSWRVKMLAEA